MSQFETGGVWVECVEHTPQLYMIGGGEAYMEDRGGPHFILREEIKATWELSLREGKV
jgi:hypothetical protein